MSAALTKKILFVLGGPGAGKGTQCSKLVEKFGFVHLSAGDLLREERQSGSANGELIDRMIKEGQIVPVKITLSLLQQAMNRSGRDLFLIDGFPRNFDNLQGWQEEMAEDEFQVQGVLFYDCPESVMEERLMERGKTSGRTDDNAEAIRKRFRTYLDSTMPVIMYYEKQDKVFKVDATPGPDEVFEATSALIGPLVADNTHATMSFEESMTTFYVAFAEQQLDQVCQALGDMRVSAQRSSSGDADAAAVRNEMLRACELKAQGLQTSALEQLKQACAGADVDVDAALIAFARCSALGAAWDAAPRFSSCLETIFATQARASLDRVRGSKQTAKVNENGYIDRAFYVEALSELLTGATDIMNAVADVTSDAQVLQQVLSPIHSSSAEIALQIVQMYAGDARMVAWERRANAQAQRDPRQALEGDDVEADESLQMMDLFLDELAFIIRVLVSYTAFLTTVCEGLGRQDGSDGFQIKVQELSGVYLVLERFYVFQSVHKATAIAEPQELEQGVYVSSVVEDVSFVLNKAFFRASQCMSYHTTLSIVIALVDALESQYLPAIMALPSRPYVIPLIPTNATTASGSNVTRSSSTTRLDTEAEGEQNDVSFSDMLLQAVDEDLERSLQEEARLIMTINSAFMSGEFIHALHEKINAFSRAGFPNDAPILECLPTPIHEMSEAFRSIVANEVQEVLSRSLRKRLSLVIQRQMDEQLQYVLTSTQYDAFGSQGSPLLQLVEQEVIKNRELRRYERALCSAPFEDLVEAVTQDLTSCVERALLVSRKPCNDLGALQLEREVTDMLARTSTLVPQKSLRAAFTRLFQVVFILNLMQPSHVLDYLASVREELSVETITTLLRMRVDFKQQDVVRAVEQMTKVDVKNAASKTSAPH
ncbi:hypothetical protein BBO99_00000717 [Phytophthora kernoviae]|uniref:UMP-CMP kinase n=1 Tax=Phytophthora kernoviae TaxID=325452 RepID=A0A421F871_9STRA|nr:hypothetical protein JM16_005937 [Phytophthora kernoviae]KAG2523848.1 hypothetical protein JM18_005596 [Phytophthora kernoviae]RLN27372.1 hypothetical protein BBI17_002739 [Phytophthora kernoviae]RLN85252.1 hypothetical protein BBO99_00000717 [Phytophthora kernoviae]